MEAQLAALGTFVDFRHIAALQVGNGVCGCLVDVSLQSTEDPINAYRAARADNVRHLWDVLCYSCRVMWSA